MGLANTLNRRAKNASRQKHQLVVSVFQVFFVKSVSQVYFSKTNTILCASEIKACNENKCQNEGKCQEIGTDEYSCLCPIGFTGKHCECNYYV